ncbi:DUF6343 family protein [Actinacidiphila glaucinigra]|uniref:DUF6343 family protein n=1 Tax=Actinacidiphila glaucinigra TaxID=235986 RepID=UPI002E363F77|nr:DUF6343 family protein [Actinacidiphila glaucinigra]
MPMGRTGNEPLRARSALRTRLALAAFGLAWAIAGTVLFAELGRTGWAVFFGLLALAAAIDLVVIVRHIRQGAHWQPGRDVPPYEPLRKR